MGAEFGVSITVVQEAIASWRSDGLVGSRKGPGFSVLNPAAIEEDAAAVAAVRRSPAQEEEVIATISDFRSFAR